MPVTSKMLQKNLDLIISTKLVDDNTESGADRLNLDLIISTKLVDGGTHPLKH